ncbi:hypothetical protein Vadar_007046 [Vaccinium darrowii]|uniref:Uncharacterized protein n=1 Tax=Vaccinium darrowii TaxID=229202 RepID=A0ACB7Y584_9ERIC|nr:hypothetical protein Vadar_007046 [Vaccinium darrowii]
MELLTRKSVSDIISGQSGAVDLTDWVRLCNQEGVRDLIGLYHFPGEGGESVKPSFLGLQFSMAKRKAKNKKSASSPKFEKKEEDTFRDQDVDRRSAAIRAIRDVEIDHLLTELRLLRSNFNKQQRQIPVLQFFTENLPNLSLVKNGKGQYEVQWKDKGGTLPMNQGDGIDIHASLLHQMSAAYPDRSSTAIPSFGGFKFSSQAVTASLLGADNLQIKDFVTSHRMSVGMTPKTLRLPKNGEMLLSVHGSPLGVYEEDNMESIRVTHITVSVPKCREPALFLPSASSGLFSATSPSPPPPTPAASPAWKGSAPPSTTLFFFSVGNIRFLYCPSGNLARHSDSAGHGVSSASVDNSVWTITIFCSL